jgi:hypothetical protein
MEGYWIRGEESVATFADAAAAYNFGRTRTEAWSQGICVDCGKPADEFRNDRSLLEYHEFSGFCQKCQDEFTDLVGGENWKCNRQWTHRGHQGGR